MAGYGDAANWSCGELGIDVGQNRVNAQLGLFPFAMTVQQALDHGDNRAAITVKARGPRFLEGQQDSNQLETILFQAGYHLAGQAARVHKQMGKTRIGARATTKQSFTRGPQGTVHDAALAVRLAAGWHTAQIRGFLMSSGRSTPRYCVWSATSFH